MYIKLRYRQVLHFVLKKRFVTLDLTDEKICRSLPKQNRLSVCRIFIKIGRSIDFFDNKVI